MEHSIEFEDYFTAMIWADLEYNEDLGMDTSAIDITIIDTASISEQQKQCREFFEKADFILENTEYTQSQAEHDFLLTRQGHGAGFWENDHCKQLEGEALTNLAQQFPTLNYYALDGVIYIE